MGGANPTGVSYYMMPLSGPHKGSVLTVGKASVDFFGSELVIFKLNTSCSLICSGRFSGDRS